MSIRKRGDRFQVRLPLGDGRRLERTLPPGATRADAHAAEAHLRRQLVDIAAGRDPARLIDSALDRYEAAARGLKSYDKDLRYRIAALREWTRGRVLDELPDVAARLQADGIASGLQAASVNRYLAILRRCGYLAVKWGWTDKALGERVEMLPGEGSREVFLTRAQVRALLDACPREESRDLIALAALTGMRRGEILRLSPEDVVDGHVILPSRTKSGKPRFVPLPAQARAIVRRRLPWSITARMLRDDWEAARAAAGLPHVHLHDLRHTFASWMVRGDVPLAALRDLLGHSSLAVTSKYTHLARPDLVEATKKLRV